MPTNKKQIKKELKKVTNLISKLSKKRIKNNQSNLITLHQGVKDIKTVVKYILKQKDYNFEPPTIEKNQNDLVAE